MIPAGVGSNRVKRPAGVFTCDVCCPRGGGRPPATTPTARPRGDCAREYICLPCISATARTLSPGTEDWLKLMIKTRDKTYIFPAQSGAAFAAVDVADGVVSGRHRAVVRLAFEDINARKTSHK